MKIPFLKLFRRPGSISTLNRRDGCIGGGGGGFGTRTTTRAREECDGNYVSLSNLNSAAERPLTLEDMIFRLEVDEQGGIHHRRRSYAACSDDVVASATNALKECPRFSLDGRDAKYQCSFKSADSASFEEKLKKDGFDVALKKDGHTGLLPPARASGAPLWRKPSVVGRLMGLDAMPVREEQLAGTSECS